MERRRWTDRWMPWWIATLAVLVALSTLLSMIALGRVGDQATSAQDLAERNRAITTQIQAERARNVLSNCQDINQRHNNTIRELDRIYRRRIQAASPAGRTRLKESRDGTVLLIQALVPKRDCRALAERQVDGRTP